MAETLDWIVIKGHGDREIGALGFIGNKVAVITSFYDDKDGNMDGKVSWSESFAAFVSPINLTNKAVMTVVMQARIDDDVYQRDDQFRIVAAHMYTNFALGLIADGIYKVYFSGAVGNSIKPIAGRLTTNYVLSYVIRKGMEAQVKKLYDASLSK